MSKSTELSSNNSLTIDDLFRLEKENILKDIEDRWLRKLSHLLQNNSILYIKADFDTKIQYWIEKLQRIFAEEKSMSTLYLSDKKFKIPIILSYKEKINSDDLELEESLLKIR